MAFNIVEGCGAAGRKEFARFLEISIKSSNELEYQLALASDYGILPRDKWCKLNTKTIDIRRMLCGLRAKLLRDDAKFIRDDAKRVTRDARRATRHGEIKKAPDFREPFSTSLSLYCPGVSVLPVTAR